MDDGWSRRLVAHSSSNNTQNAQQLAQRSTTIIFNSSTLNSYKLNATRNMERMGMNAYNAFFFASRPG